MTFTLRATGLGEADRRPTPLLLLDADGTVRRGGPGEPFVNTEADVEVHPEAAVRIGEHRARGGRVAIVSNQGGVGAGILTNEAVAAAMRETVRQIAAHLGDPDESPVDVVTWCAHDPGRIGDTQTLGRPTERCWCRKPAPGLLIAAAMLCGQQCPGEYYPLDLVRMVGDQDDDRDAAAAAGVAFQWASDWREGR